MKLPHVILSGVAVAALALPIAVIAQTTQAQPPTGAQAGSYQGHGMMRMYRNLNLSAQQQQQIQSLMQQYRTAHPRGSQPDPTARKQLREQIMAVLTPAQQAQLKQEMEQRREQRAERANAPEPSPSPAV